MSAQVLHNINIDLDDGWPCLNESLVLEIGLVAVWKTLKLCVLVKKIVFTDRRQNCKL